VLPTPTVTRPPCRESRLASRSRYGQPQCMNGSTRICIMQTHDDSMSWQLERVHSRVQRVIGFLRCNSKGGPTGLCPRLQCVRMGDKRSRQCAPFTLALSFRVSGLIRTSASCPAGLWDAMRSVSWVSLDTKQLWSLHCASHEARCRWRELFMFSHGAQCRWEAHMSPRVVASQRCGDPLPSNVCLAHKLLFLCVATAPRGCV
jgi:hypothetical protein